jgi:hypothetical protein
MVSRYGGWGQPLPRAVCLKAAPVPGGPAEPASRRHLLGSFPLDSENKVLVSCLYGIYATKYDICSTFDGGDMTMVDLTRARQEVEENAEYRQRMVVNLVAASFITFLTLTGYWVVNTLAG